MVPPTAVKVDAVTDTEAATVPKGLTINGVASRRAKAGKLSGGIAAATSSDLFKSQVGFPECSEKSSLSLCGCQTFLQELSWPICAVFCMDFVLKSWG